MTGLGLLPIRSDPGAKCLPPEPFLNLPNDARRLCALTWDFLKLETAEN